MLIRISYPFGYTFKARGIYTGSEMMPEDTVTLLAKNADFAYAYSKSTGQWYFDRELTDNIRKNKADLSNMIYFD